MNRLFFRFAGGILVAILLAFAAAVCIVRDSIDRQMVEEGPPGVTLLLTWLQDELGPLPAAERTATLDKLEAEAGFPWWMGPPEERALPEGADRLLVEGQTGLLKEDHSWVAVIPLADGQVVVLGPSTRVPHPTTRDFAWILVVWLGVVGAFGLALTVPVARRLRRLETAAVRLGAGELATRAPARPGGDAVDSLARRFNAMADQLQALLRNQQQLVQAVAHEIRTPIARLRFGMEMAAMAGDEDARARRIEGVQEDLAEMEALVEELLVFSRYDAGEARTELQEVPLAATVERQVERLAPLREGLEVRVVPPEEAPASVRADARAFNRVLGNLLSNALRYARTRVQVRWAGLPDGGVEVVVLDDGPGVPPDQREQVFEPFARLDRSRDRASGGVGLGLAIVRRILAAHGGTVHVEETPGGGAKFVTRWPGGA